MIEWPIVLFINLPQTAGEWIRMLQFFIVLYLSVSIHECAHAWAANRNGDDTARLMGRMTINPVPHIDIIGTVIIPLFSYVSSGFALIGWGKPVPVNPVRFRNHTRGEIETSLAGVVSNVILMVAALLLMRFLLRVAPSWSRTNQVLPVFLGQLALLNMVLCLFNLIPIHPLDGSHVFRKFLSREALHTYDRLITPYGWIILLVLLNVGALRFVFNIGFRVMLLFVSDLEIWSRVLRR